MLVSSRMESIKVKGSSPCTYFAFASWSPWRDPASSERQSTNIWTSVCMPDTWRIYTTLPLFPPRSLTNCMVSSSKPLHMFNWRKAARSSAPRAMSTPVGRAGQDKNLATTSPSPNPLQGIYISFILSRSFRRSSSLISSLQSISSDFL